MTITNWPEDERPREKLLSRGAKALTDAELLAIFIRTGIRGKTALDIARELIIEFGGLKPLLQANPHDLYAKKGLGPVTFASLKAALELGSRYQEAALIRGEKLDNCQTAKRFLASRLQHYPHEVFACLFLDSHHGFLGFEELFHGTINEANVYPREVVKRGLARNAAKIILAHNHPSGNPSPSQSDHEVTTLLKDSLALVNIQVIDHIIIGQQESISLAETGFL